MQLEEVLRSLIKGEDSEIKKCVLYMLLKYSESVENCEENKIGECLPLFTVQNGRYTLVYQDKNVDDFEYIFTDYVEMLIIIEKIVNDNRKIYFYCDSFENVLSQEEVLEKINQAIEKEDKESFNYYASFYSKIKNNK